MVQHPTPIRVHDLLSQTKCPKCAQNAKMEYYNVEEMVEVTCKECGSQLYSVPGYLEMGWPPNSFADEHDI